MPPSPLSSALLDPNLWELPPLGVFEKVEGYERVLVIEVAKSVGI